MNCNLFITFGISGSADSSDNPPDIFASTISPANQYNYPTHILVNGQLCAITADETFNIYDYIDNSHNKRAVNPALVTPAPVVAPPPLLYPVAIESEESQDSTTSIESVSSFGDQPPKYENLSSSQVTKIHVAPQDQSMLRVVDERKN